MNNFTIQCYHHKVQGSSDNYSKYNVFISTFWQPCTQKYFTAKTTSGGKNIWGWILNPFLKQVAETYTPPPIITTVVRLTKIEVERKKIKGGIVIETVIAFTKQNKWDLHNLIKE